MNKLYPPGRLYPMNNPNFVCLTSEERSDIYDHLGLSLNQVEDWRLHWVASHMVRGVLKLDARGKLDI